MRHYTIAWDLQTYLFFSWLVVDEHGLSITLTHSFGTSSPHQEYWIAPLSKGAAVAGTQVFTGMVLICWYLFRESSVHIWPMMTRFSYPDPSGSITGSTIQVLGSSTQSCHLSAGDNQKACQV